MKLKLIAVTLLLGVVGLSGYAKEEKKDDESSKLAYDLEKKKKGVAPTLKDVKYGPHKKNSMNFWKVESDKPLGILVSIHGGGWRNGQKQENMPEKELKNGYHCASINYPLTRSGAKLPSMVHSAARAIQFIRYKAKEWNIDPDRILVQGGSAGGASSLWLAYHDDMANPKSSDPIERESSRVAGAISMSGQSTLNPFITKERIGAEVLKHHMLYLPLS